MCMPYQARIDASLHDAHMPELLICSIVPSGNRRLASLPGFEQYPLSDLATWGPEVSSMLDPTQETVVLCHHGVRSMNVAEWLVDKAGFTRVRNVTGGIDSYAREVDISLGMY